MDRRRTIIKTISRSFFALLIAVIIGVGHAPLANAQFGGIVYDPANYRQNFMTAVRSYTQIVRQGQQLRNEANMLINQAKHLSKLDLNSVNDLNRILSEIAYLNAQADNVAYEVGRTRQLVKEYFPQSYEDFSEDELMVRAEQQWQMSQRAYNDAMVMQSKMVESLETRLIDLGFSQVDYLTVRDTETLAPIDTITKPARILVAAKIGKPRLLDNMAVEIKR